MNKETSSRVSTIAARLTRITASEIDRLANSEKPETEILAEEIRTLAASALSQDETPGQQPTTFLDRLKHERAELAGRHGKLAVFLDGAGIGAISHHQRSLLDAQLSAMKLYLSLLDMRLHNLDTAPARSRPRVASEPTLGEPEETGGHDLDRDGPIPFDN